MARGWYSCNLNSVPPSSYETHLIPPIIWFTPERYCRCSIYEISPMKLISGEVPTWQYILFILLCIFLLLLVSCCISRFTRSFLYPIYFPTRRRRRGRRRRRKRRQIWRKSFRNYCSWNRAHAYHQKLLSKI